MDIHNEALNEWNAGFAEAGRPTQYDANFSKFLTEHESAVEDTARKHLQPWLHILEDSIQWLSNLTVILERLNADEMLGAAERSVWLLIGASCAHAMAVRRLVLSGLDTPARAEARILDEHLCACIALLHDRQLGERFYLCESKEDTAQFWYQNLNTKSLKKCLNTVERDMGVEQIVSSELRAWRANEIEWFSQAIHPSYLGAGLTTYTISASDLDSTGPAFLGMASACSDRTLDFSCKSIWYFACFGFTMLFDEHGSNRPVIELDKENEMHQLVVVGRGVLQTLNRKYWSYERFPSNEVQLDVE